MKNILVPTNKVTIDPLIASELCMTFIQLAQDYWNAFRNDQFLKGKATIDKFMFAEHLNNVYRGIKNRMIRAEGYDGMLAYSAMLEHIAENVDELQPLCDILHDKFKEKIIQLMPFNMQEPMVNSAIATIMIKFANDSAKLIGDGGDSRELVSAFNISNNIPETLQFDFWGDMKDIIADDLTQPIINKAIAISSREWRRRADEKSRKPVEFHRQRNYRNINEKIAQSVDLSLITN